MNKNEPLGIEGMDRAITGCSIGICERMNRNGVSGKIRIRRGVIPWERT
jgi:hypothetical protein